jgi:hypothetical protein
MRQAVEIHKEREDVLVNSSSILSRRERGKVMDIAVVGSAALLRLILATPAVSRERIAPVAHAKGG